MTLLKRQKLIHLLLGSVALLNGLITNDKFCFTRDVRLKLTWWRRALKQRSVASSSVTILTGCGSSDETPMDEASSSA
jgi:hypothetical protein